MGNGTYASDETNAQSFSDFIVERQNLARYSLSIPQQDAAQDPKVLKNTNFYSPDGEENYLTQIYLYFSLFLC